LVRFISVQDKGDLLGMLVMRKMSLRRGRREGEKGEDTPSGVI